VLFARPYGLPGGILPPPSMLRWGMSRDRT